MLAIKNSRKSLRLLHDEEDNLLAGMDFQTYYLGTKEILVDNNDLDAVVEGIYSQYTYDADINNTTQLTITVDTNQLVFRDVVTHHIKFIIALTNVKSVYFSDKKTKFANSVIVVCSLPNQNTATVHVLHCLSHSQARQFYNAINCAFEFQREAFSMESGKSSPATQDKSTAFVKANKDIRGNSLSRFQVNKTKSMKYHELNTKTPSENKKSSDNEHAGLLGAEGLSLKERENSQNEKIRNYVKEIELNQFEDKSGVKLKSHAKSNLQTKVAEGRGLLDNIDPDDGFDDEFMDLARTRSFSDNIKFRFGR